MTQWQTWGVEWTPNNLVYTLNGNIWGTVVNDPNVPAIPMVMDMQAQATRAAIGHVVLTVAHLQM